MNILIIYIRDSFVIVVIFFLARHLYTEKPLALVDEEYITERLTNVDLSLPGVIF